VTFRAPKDSEVSLTPENGAIGCGSRRAGNARICREAVVARSPLRALENELHARGRGHPEAELLVDALPCGSGAQVDTVGSNRSGPGHDVEYEHRSVTLAAMLGQGDDVREAHGAPPDALRAWNADLQGADGRSYELAIYLDHGEPGIPSVVDIPREPLTGVALPRLLGCRAALVKQKSPKTQKPGTVPGLCGSQAAGTDLGHFTMLARVKRTTLP
jgi:hypothetical protein